MIRKKVPVYIMEKDLGELYTYLELFGKVYDGYDTQIETLMKGIEEVYAHEYRCKDPEKALRRLRNPREAGRKQKYTQEQIEQVRELAREGRSIREIAEESGISKSSVQRWLKS